jgi:hypothetical protein
MTYVLTTDENGALTVPPDLLGSRSPRTQYSVHVGDDVVVLRRTTTNNADLSHEEWRTQWLELANQVGEQWKLEKSAAELISEMRR